MSLKKEMPPKENTHSINIKNDPTTEEDLSNDSNNSTGRETLVIPRGGLFGKLDNAGNQEVTTSKTGWAEAPVTDYHTRSPLKGPIPVPSSTINGQEVPGWQTERNEEGKLHASGEKPSCVHFNGLQEWHKEGLLHRENGLPARIHPDGRIELWENGSFRISDKKDKIRTLNSMVDEEYGSARKMQKSKASKRRTKKNRKRKRK